MTREIPLRSWKHGDLVALIDDEDWPIVAQHRWGLARINGYVYAVTRVRKPNGGYATIYMHRLITGAPKGILVDHRDSCGINNRRSNLRLANRSENRANSLHRKKSRGGYVGVRVYGPSFHAYLRDKHLGRFQTAEDAARAYDAAALAHYGQFASLNFPSESIA